MFGVIFWAIVGIGIVLVVIAVVTYALILRRGYRVGTHGLVQRSHLTCPRCHQGFDYDWVPGASLTSVRLGTKRYMKCPLCGRGATFDLYGTMIARTPESSSISARVAPPPPSPP